MRMLGAGLVILLLGARAPQDPKDPNPDKEFQKKVDAAIDKGMEYLLKRFPRGNIPEPRKLEILLLTLVHAGLDRKHPFLVKNMNKLLRRNLTETYNVGLRGLLLEKLDRKYYQRQLAEIALFFIQSQCRNGQWTYNGKGPKPGPTGYRPTPTKSKKPPLPGSTQTDDDGIPPGKPVKLPPPRRGSGVQTGDNSNSQYAVLGFFAAERANVLVPKETWERLEQWFESKQNSDGGWGYANADVPEGGGNGIVTNQSTGSMTTSGLTGLIVSKFYLKKDWKSDPAVQKGLAWLGSHLSYSNNPGGHAVWHYYYLYGLERVGAITGMKEFGGKDWYRGGAEYLLKEQRDDGSWSESTSAGDFLIDDDINTCFAILFLRRSTPELERPKDVATGDRGKKK